MRITTAGKRRPKAGRKLVNRSGTGDGAFRTNNRQILQAVFAARKRGLAFFAEGRAQDGALGLCGFSLAGMDIVSVSKSQRHGYIVALDKGGNLLLLLRGMYDPGMLLLRLPKGRPASYYKVACMDDALAVLTPSALILVPDAFLRTREDSIVYFVLPQYGGVDLEVFPQGLVLTRPDGGLKIPASELMGAVHSGTQKLDWYQSGTLEVTRIKQSDAQPFSYPSSPEGHVRGPSGTRDSRRLQDSLQPELPGQSPRRYREAREVSCI